jgi:hypothetical protein
MKNIINKLLFLLCGAMMLVSCKKDENQIQFLGGTNPVLSANRTDVIPLTFLTKDDEAVKFSWTNPDYKFTTGISSQDVNYTLEMDVAGASFSSPNVKRISISKDLTVSYTQNQINDIMLNQLGFSTGQQYSVEVRIVSALFNNNERLISNTLTFSATPYAIPPKVTPPGTSPDYSDGRLFLVGSASPGGWNNPVPVPTQEFTRISSTVYELTLQMNPGSYLLLPINGFWGAKYGGLGSNNTNNPDGDDFKPEGGDLRSPTTSGTYKIVVDFQRGKFSLTRQ